MKNDIYGVKFVLVLLTKLKEGRFFFKNQEKIDQNKFKSKISGFAKVSHFRMPSGSWTRETVQNFGTVSQRGFAFQAFRVSRFAFAFQVHSHECVGSMGKVEKWYVAYVLNLVRTWNYCCKLEIACADGSTFVVTMP